MKDTLANHVKLLLADYFPAQGDIQVVVAAAVGAEQYFFTFRNHPESDTPAADENTVFEIGAVTMVFTTCLLGDMVSKQDVRLNDPIKRYLPPTVRVPSYRGQEITLLDLGNHTSALPRLPTNFPETVKDPADPCRHYTVEHLYAFLTRHTLRRPIGWRRDFSNLGIGLLGHVLSLGAKKDYQELVRERICAPLEMSDTRVNLTPEQEQRFLQGHSVKGEAVKPWDMGALVAAGGLRSTARDLLCFVRTQLTKNRPGNKGPLRSAARICQKPRRKSGRPPWLAAGFGATLGMCALALAALWYFPIMPATGWFVACFFTPVLLAGLYGGVWTGLLAAFVQSGGAYLLVGADFDTPLHGAACLLVAWFASSSHRRRAQPETLGWEQLLKGVPRLPKRILWQSGETGGHAAFVGYREAGAMAVVVLSNCAAPLALIGFDVFNYLIALPVANRRNSR
jgi:CubicO group peptidase (beta-lactamase class C family)